MTDTAEIWADPAAGLAIRLDKAPSEAAVGLLSRTVWGNRGTRYRILDLGTKLTQLRAPYCFSLLRNESLVAVCLLDRCEKRVLGASSDAFHFVMAATDPASQEQGLAELLMARVRRFCERNLRPPGLGFAYIEASQDISLRISERIGHAIEAELSLVLFSRLLRRTDRRVGPASATDRPELVARLQALYADHELADFAHSVSTTRTLVLRDGGKIAASAQIEALHWRVEALRGRAGAVLLRVLPLLPGVNRIANPRNLTLLRVGNVLVEPGEEPALVALLETALVEHGAAIAFLMMDQRSDVLARIRAHDRLGLLGQLMSASVKLHLYLLDRSDAEMAEIAARPMLVSPADVF